MKKRTKPFPSQYTIDGEEMRRAMDVLKTKRLSSYRGNSGPNFLGGPMVKTLEDVFSTKMETGYAIPTNSCTSALIIACGAIGLKPGDEVIVTPYSMTCSATAPLHYGATPVFADVEPDHYCLDPVSIEKKITEKTKAIIVVDLFGQACDAVKIREIADRHNLFVIEDAAQAIGSYYKGSPTGSLFDIGCFSFTQGKHLTAGEGGMVITHNDDLAQKCRLIMNHAEAVINAMDTNPIFPPREAGFENMVGFNMRMTEIQAAILIEQVKKLDYFVYLRQNNVAKINKVIKEANIPPLIIANEPRLDSTHSYYVQAFKWNHNLSEGMSREQFVNGVSCLLPPETGREDRSLMGYGYIKPIHLMPLFRFNAHWSLKNPWLTKGTTWERYYRGMCPVVENLYENELIISMMHALSLEDEDIEYIGDVFKYVWDNREEGCQDVQ